MSFNFSPKTVTDGLVLYLDAANPKSYVSGSPTWIDISKNSNNGTLTNGPTYSTANNGSIVFDGVDDYVATNFIPSSSDYTFCVWGKSSSGGFSNRILGNGDSTAGLHGADIIWAYSTNIIYSVRRNGANNATRDIQSSVIANLATGWHYIVVTYNSSTGSVLYCDTIRVGSNAVTGFTSTLPFRIGRDGNGADKFNGNVSQVSVYNRALSATEILQNYNATKTRFGL
jgi:hypothetical protein